MVHVRGALGFDAVGVWANTHLFVDVLFLLCFLLFLFFSGILCVVSFRPSIFAHAVSALCDSKPSAGGRPRTAAINRKPNVTWARKKTIRLKKYIADNCRKVEEKFAR